MEQVAHPFVILLPSGETYNKEFELKLSGTLTWIITESSFVALLKTFKTLSIHKYLFDLDLQTFFDTLHEGNTIYFNSCFLFSSCITV